MDSTHMDELHAQRNSFGQMCTSKYISGLSNKGYKPPKRTFAQDLDRYSEPIEHLSQVLQLCFEACHSLGAQQDTKYKTYNKIHILSEVDRACMSAISAIQGLTDEYLCADGNV